MMERSQPPLGHVPAGAPAIPEASNPAPRAPAADFRVEDYLDHVCAPLVGVVPYARRQELRAELRAHVEALIDSYHELGRSREVAVVEALRQFGDPRSVARQWAREWNQVASPGRVQAPWQAMGTALASFGLATVLAFPLLAVLQQPGPSSDPAAVSLFLVLFLLPFLAGITTGIRANARHALGTFYALAGILPLLAVPLKLGQDPLQTASLARFAMEMSLIQSCLWLPIGCGAAALGGWLRQRLLPRPGRWVLQ